MQFRVYTGRGGATECLLSLNAYTTIYVALFLVLWFLDCLINGILYGKTHSSWVYVANHLKGILLSAVLEINGNYILLYEN